MKVFYVIVTLVPAILAIAYCFNFWRKRVLKFSLSRWNSIPGWISPFRGVLLLYLLIFHFLSQMVFSPCMDLLPSTIVMVMIYSDRVLRNLFWFLRGKLNMFVVMLLGVTCLVTNHFFFLGFTLLVILIGACYFSLGDRDMVYPKLKKKYFFKK